MIWLSWLRAGYVEICVTRPTVLYNRLIHVGFQHCARVCVRVRWLIIDNLIEQISITLAQYRSRGIGQHFSVPLSLAFSVEMHRDYHVLRQCTTLFTAFVARTIYFASRVYTMHNIWHLAIYELGWAGLMNSGFPFLSSGSCKNKWTIHVFIRQGRREISHLYSSPIDRQMDYKLV